MNHDESVKEYDNAMNKEHVDWDQLSFNQWICGVMTTALSAALIVLFFLGLFLNWQLPFNTFDQFALNVIFFSILLTAGCGLFTMYYSYQSTDDDVKSGMKSVVICGAICAALNIISLLWMLGVALQPFTLVTILVALLGSTSSVMTNYYNHYVFTHKDDFSLYVKRDGKKYFLIRNGKNTELLCEPLPLPPPPPPPPKEEPKPEPPPIIVPEEPVEEHAAKHEHIQWPIIACVSTPNTNEVLTWNNKAEEGTFLCNACNFDKDPSDGKWEIPEQDLKICNSCRPFCVPTLLHSFSQCVSVDGGHPLKWTKDTTGYPRDEYVCRVCNAKENCRKGRWACIRDKFDVCGKCRPLDQAQAKCPQNHPLVWRVDPNQNEFDCDECKEVRRPRNGMWICEECNYKICTLHKAPVAPLAMCFIGISPEQVKKRVECREGHPLIWTRDVSGYAENDYICNSCNKQGKPFSEGRWTCTQCKRYNVCPECRPDLSKFMFCQSKHPLKWIMDPAGVDEETFDCAICQTTRVNHEGKWACDECLYYVCAKCRTPVSTKIMESYIECPKGDMLEWTCASNNYQLNKYLCAVCKRNFLCTNGRWACLKCQYDVCAFCRSKEELPLEPSEIAKIVCSKGHPFYFSKDRLEPRKAEFICGYCKKEQKYSDGAWRCLCKEIVCSACRPFKPLALCSNYGECDKQGHPLVWSTAIPPKSKDSVFTCQMCLKGKIPYSDGRWTCKSECNYGICSNCRPEFTVDALKDMHPHGMDWSVNTEAGRSYTCEKCRASKMSCNGRWSCNSCNSSICPNCVPPLSPLFVQGDAKCRNGHFFTWTTSKEGYPSGKFKCSKCRKEDACEKGRWGCLCRENICSDCKSSWKVFSSCSNNHPLQWNTEKSSNADNNYECKLCKKVHKANDGRWSCIRCNYDICFFCRPPLSHTSVASYLECDSKHQLVWKFDSFVYPSKQYKCRICKADQLECVFGRWCCEACQYDVCPACRQSTGNDTIDYFYKMPITRIIQCTQGHLLKFTKDSVSKSEGKFQCFICKKKQPGESGRWNCKDCQYDICDICRPKDLSTVILTAYTQCRTGHSLVWNNDTSDYANFVCSVCKSPGNSCDEGRWGCIKCKYDICQTCRPLDKGDLKDKKGHLLTWANFDMDYKDLNFNYKCAKCSKLLPCNSWRWNCNHCRYDICPDCRNPVAPLTVSEDKVLDNENHELYWSCNEQGYNGDSFTCVQCKKSYKLRTKRWTCIKCKFDLCSACRPGPNSYLKCQSKHSLLWSTSLTKEEQEPLFCKNCERAIIIENGRWFCEECQYSICTRCRPPISPIAMLPFTGCRFDHPLVWSNDKTGSGKLFYDCATCSRKDLACAYWRWTCKRCNFDVCHACRSMKEAHIKEGKESLPKTCYKQCPKGHLLLFSQKENKGIKCFFCDTEIACKNGYWSCDECKYYACLNCRQKQEVGTVYSGLVQCKKSHPLEWTTNPAGCKDGEFTCNICNKANRCPKGRWGCIDCKYNICNVCRPSKCINLLDPNGHEMVWSNDTANYPAKKYSCGKCKLVGRCTEGRWSCATCNYDICQACQSPFGPIIFSSQTQCDKGHFLFWSTDSSKCPSGDYQCSLCKSTSRCSKGRSVCNICEVNICTACKPLYPKYILCELDHLLVWTMEGLSESREPVSMDMSPPGKIKKKDLFKCTCCKKESDALQGRWTCKTCEQYNICTSCRVPLDPDIITPYVMCQKQHALNWTFNEKGYSSKKYRCVVCSKEGECKLGRWGCDECNYDVCPGCRTIEEEQENPSALSSTSTLQCPAGHLLKFADTKYNIDTYECAVCRKSYSTNENRWNCEQCSYDVCTSCRTPNISPIVSLIPYLQCKGIHPLIYSNSSEGYSNQNFTCAVCQAEKTCAEGRWNCETCHYDVCTICRPRIESLVDPANHTLTWSTDYTEQLAKKYSCAMCKHLNNCDEGRWYCKVCKYNICSLCQPPLAALVVLSSPLKDKMGHNLTLTKENTLTGDTFECAECNKEAKCINGRWNCTICNYDVCTACKRPCVAYYRCDAKHPLVWSTSDANYRNKVYTCKACGKEKPCSIGRMCCIKCQYDICNCCRPPLSHEAFKPFIECKSEHLLTWSLEDDEYPDKTYTCAMCQAVSICAIGRWTCLKDKYDLCNICRAKEIDEEIPVEEKTKRPITVTIQCHRGHPLILSNENANYDDSKYRCTFCKKLFPCTQERWCCPDCKYDTCTGCRPNENNISVLIPYTQCREGHTLTWSITTDQHKDGKFECDWCKKWINCSDGRWNDKLCEYDVCSACRQKQEGSLQDKEGHPLVWSCETAGYEGKIFLCQECNKMSKCKYGRWTCKTCKFNFCSGCRAPFAPLAGVKLPPVDQSNHGLIWTIDSTDYADGQFECKVCKQKSECKLGRWNCKICQYDICCICNPQFFNFARCNNKHRINWKTSVEGYKDGKYECRICKQTNDCKLGRWGCTKGCIYDICTNCRPSVSPNVLTPYVECRKQHPLIWSNYCAGYPSKKYKCVMCLREEQCSQGRWSCAVDKYDICTLCRNIMDEEGLAAKEAEAAKQPRTASKILVCNNNHNLFLTKSDVGYPKQEFTCVACKQVFPCSQDRWQCAEDLYDICAECRPINISVFALAPYMQCENAHSLTWKSTNVGYPDDNYKCYLCKKTCKCSAGRWSCEKCIQDVCPACKPNVGDDLKDEQSHYLSWSTNSTSYLGKKYTCAGCKTLLLCKNGRWNCADCRYDVCGKCKSPVGPMVFIDAPSDADHPMKWTIDAKNYENESYECFKCKSKKGCKAGRYNCKICVKDICPACKPPQSALFQCKTKHTLVWTMSEKGCKDNKFLCNTCMQTKEFTEGRWTCPSDCDYNVCIFCRPPLTTSILSPYSRCHSGHDLIFVNECAGYDNKIYPCAICGRDRQCIDGRWSCLQDKYDVCQTCRQYIPEEKVAEAEAQQKPEGINRTGIVMCVKNHLLVQTTTAEGYENSEYSCNQCNNNFPCSEKRWSCPEDKYDVCFTCRPSTLITGVLLPYTQCREGHQLIWSDNKEGYSNDQYKCSLCNKDGDCKAGRFTCENCLYNLCKDCCPQKISDLKCEKDHELLWNTDCLGYVTKKYNCATCKKEKWCNEGRWSCSECSYNICYLCRPAVSALGFIAEPYEDKDGHPLIWSISSQGYNDGTYACEKCSKNKKCEEGRYSCRKCKIDVCPDCKAPQSTFSKCKSGHNLMWNISNDAEEQFTCQACKQAHVATDGKWSCTQSCEYEICCMCRPALSGGVIAPYKECKKAHSLIWTTDHTDYSDGKYTCVTCYKIRDCALGRWCCLPDKYDVCPVCRNFYEEDRQEIELEKEELENERQKRCGFSDLCEKQHSLIVSNTTTGYSDGRYTCKHCSKSFPCEKVRWHCPECLYDICSNCNHIVSSTTLLLLPYAQCKVGHNLLWSTDNPSSSEDSFTCKICNKKKNCLIGRWNCKICQFDICDECRPPYEGIIKDQDGHFFSWSTSSTGYIGGVYHCVNCKKISDCYKGRWSCSHCNYDLCPLCRPPVSPFAVMSSPLEDPANHSLYWSMDSTGYKDGKYKCMLCNNDFQCSKGRWNCVECKYNICPACRSGKSLALMCPNNHPLSWNDSEKGYPDKKYSCSLCKQAKLCETGRWNCSQCKHEVCDECRPMVSPMSMRIYLECNHGHLLEWSRECENPLDIIYVCAACGKKQDCTLGRWCCIPDKYNICPACRFIKDDEAIIEEEKKDSKNKSNTSLIQCLKNHMLKISVESDGYKDKMFTCKICGLKAACTNPRWNCNECKYDICIQCRPNSQPFSLIKEYVQCISAHPLTWSTNNSGYEEDTYKCHLCEKPNQCSKGRWNCITCLYDICPKCRPAKGEEFKDKNGHKLCWNIEAASSIGKRFTCKECSEEYSCSLGRWNCENCKYNVCPKCRPPFSPLFLIDGEIEDSKGHPLFWTEDSTGYQNEQFDCMKCKKQYECSAGRWGCRLCKSDVCKFCINAPNVFIRCKNSHALEWTYSPESEDKTTYTCAACKAKKECVIGRWTCIEDKYNICPMCRPGVSDEVFYSYLEDNETNLLEWSTDDKDYPNKTFSCQICGRKGSCILGRWHGKTSGYDICGVCRGIDEDPERTQDEMLEYAKRPNITETMQCYNGHTLILSDLEEGYQDGKFTCIFCKKTKQCDQKRWSCLKCKYDVCADCRPATAFATFFGEYAQCPDFHPLIWSTGGEGSKDGKLYDCDICEREELCVDGHWSCANCSINICPICRPSKTSEELKDPAGHELIWSTDCTSYYGMKYDCKKCRKVASCKSGRWMCSACKYNMCSTCRPPISPLANAVFSQATKVDTLGHELIWSKEAAGCEDKSYQCISCKDDYLWEYGRWCCEKCLHNVCPNCLLAPLGHFIQCNLNHPLKWTTDLDEKLYPNLRFTCATCIKSKLCAAGRWNCSKCKYDICSTCRPCVSMEVLSAYVECKKLHPLKWNTEESAQAGPTFTCAICLRGNKCINGRWSCSDCSYDVCPSCRPGGNKKMGDSNLPSKELAKSRRKKLTCTNGHSLTYSTSDTGYLLNEYKCRNCEKTGKCLDGRWVCSTDCKYDICLACRPIKNNPFILVPMFGQCINGHSLIWKTEFKEPAKEAFRCCICKKDKGKNKEGRWVCEKCDFSVCNSCRGPLPPDACESLLCLAGKHQLEWTCEDETNMFAKFSCAKCKNPYDCSKGRWCCKECKNDLCFACKPPNGTISYVEIIRCKDSHSLKWNISAEGYVNNEYKCNVCGKTRKCTAGRWCCGTCKIDICNGCRPSPLSYCHCRAGHALCWTITNEKYIGNTFNCSLCAQQGQCTQGRWSCNECAPNYDICELCRPPIGQNIVKRYTVSPTKKLLEYSKVAPETVYLNGLYQCQICGMEDACKNGRWTSEDEKYDVCISCRPFLNEPIQKENAQEEVKQSILIDIDTIAEEDKARMSIEERPSFTPTSIEMLSKDIKQIIMSLQLENIKPHRLIMPTKKAIWNKTHFFFVIDCSNSMKGNRWDSVLAGYKRCLLELSKMKEIIVTSFTFDDKVNPHVKEKTPLEALKLADKLPFSGKGTNYPRACEWLVHCMDKTATLHKDYAQCVMFLSDGMGGYPKDSVEKINRMRKSGRKMAVITIACATAEDADMEQIAVALEGEHYRVNSPVASKAVFLKVLGV